MNQNNLTTVSDEHGRLYSMMRDILNPSSNECGNVSIPLGGSINAVTFYDKMNICTGASLSFSVGTYSYDNVKMMFGELKPVMVKIDPNTSLKVYYSYDSFDSAIHNREIGNDVMVYNNPYNDRFVVVKLPGLDIISGKIITGIDISIYTQSSEISDTFHNSFIVTIVIVMIILFVSVIVLMLV